MRYKRGDELILKIQDIFGYRDKTFRAVKVQVIGFNVDCEGPDAEYLVYVPPYERLKNTFVLTTSHANWFGVDQKFIGDDVAFITAKQKIYKHMPAAEGENCDHCKEFFEGAARDKEGCYTCRACTLDPWR